MGEKLITHTHTYQLKHIFIFWHDGELQHTLADGRTGGNKDKTREGDEKDTHTHTPFEFLGSSVRDFNS